MERERGNTNKIKKAAIGRGRTGEEGAIGMAGTEATTEVRTEIDIEVEDRTFFFFLYHRRRVFSIMKHYFLMSLGFHY